MVDRGALTPNEWRSTLNLSPIDGGNEPIRRLDTAVVNSLIKKINGENYKEITATIRLLLGDGKEVNNAEDRNKGNNSI